MNYILKKVDDYTDLEIDSFYNKIYKKKKDKINRILDHNQKKKSIIAEILLKDLLNKYNLDYEKLSFDITSNGKPYIKNNDIYFSISHSDNYILVCISDKRIGCDIEETIRYDENNLKVFTSKEEIDYINSSNNPIEAYFKIFTLKESYIKLNDLALLNIKSINVVKNKELYLEDCIIKTIIDDKYVISIIEKK